MTLQLAAAPAITGSGKIDLTNNILIAPGLATDALNLINTTHQVITSAPGLFLGYKDAGGGNYEIRATVLGDTDLNGTVNVADLGNLATNFNRTDASWINGDFDYNGNVNVADLGDLATNFNQTLANGSGGGGGGAAAPASLPAAVAAVTAVPEPTAAGVLVLSAAITGAFGRRIRRKRDHSTAVARV
jgi:hypothetical protein